MRQVIYNPQKYTVGRRGGHISFERLDVQGAYGVTVVGPGYQATYLDADQALRLAGLILATHRDVAAPGFEGFEFAPSTTSCAATPMPTFTVRPSTLPRAETLVEEEPEDVGLLHPGQDRRLAALHAAKDLTSSMSGDRLRELAEWILDGRPESTEAGEQA